ncbi:putative 2OG-Fe(II) oxygenase [Alteromonas flava]|uniref:putative 2OG-Fe(II) oxygenase n=1 Tax=Alteromonas flava TaxID=2048003 RepID=UPI000C28FA03|nr:putative 2OG-Fe(II) oxygenase [Alteromonas flava]
MNMQLTQQILGAYQQRNYALVINLFNAQLSIKHCEPNIGLCYANALRHSGQIKLAQRAFELLVKRFAALPPVLNSYANFLIAQNRWDDAAKQLKGAIRLDANFCDAYVNLARLQLMQDKPELAIKTYTKAAQLRPQDPNIQIGLAGALVAQSKLSDAETIFQRLLASPMGMNDYRVLTQYAGLLRTKQQYHDALALLQRAQQINPNDAEVHAMMAANYALDQQMDKAQSCYEQAIALAPTDVTVQIEFAHFRWSQGIEQPFAPLLAAVAQPEQQYDLTIATLDLLINAEQYELAQTLLTRALPALDNDPMTLMLAARIARLTGELERAESHITNAIKYSTKPVPVSVENERGYILLALGDGTAAQKLYRRLQQREPADQGWWTLYSTALKLTAPLSADYMALCDYSLVHSALIQNDKGDEFVQQLTRKLEQVHANTHHPIGQSLRNGTQTYEDIFDDQDEIIQSLKAWIKDQAESFTKHLPKQTKHPFLSRVGQDISFTGSWSVCLRTGGYHTSHFHPQGWLSGVFYVDVPEDVNHDGQGWLQFGVPEISQLSLPADYVVKPENGRLVLFPSYMWHGTRPFNAGARRMTVAFDIIPTKM